MTGRTHRDHQVSPWHIAYAEGTVEEQVGKVMVERIAAASDVRLRAEAQQLRREVAKLAEETERLDRRVALKILPAYFVADPERMPAHVAAAEDAFGRLDVVLLNAGSSTSCSRSGKDCALSMGR